jgi:hypothetical protein
MKHLLEKIHDLPAIIMRKAVFLIVAPYSLADTDRLSDVLITSIVKAVSDYTAQYCG